MAALVVRPSPCTSPIICDKVVNNADVIIMVSYQLFANQLITKEDWGVVSVSHLPVLF